MACIRLKNISKIFPGNFTAVHDVNLDIPDQQFMVIVGPSGCGKTTTLRMIAGLDQPSDGTIYMDDKIINHLPPHERNVALVFQNYTLYPHMTVYANLAFALKLRKLNHREIEKKVRQTAQVLGIEDLLTRRPHTLSGGQRQRVALGRALIRNPNCFLLDEPLSNLDAPLRSQLRTQIKQLHAQFQITTLYVTHDQEEALTLGDRLAIMNEGTILQCDAPREIYRHPANRFVAGFIGAPPMNFFSGRLIQENNHLYFDEGSARIRIPSPAAERLTSHRNTPITLGLRPQSLHISPEHRSSQDGTTLTAQITLTELLGNKINVHLSTPHHPQFLAQLDARSDIKPGQSIPLSCDPAGLYFFASGPNGPNLLSNPPQK